jgi:pimeloyl-ACP methyl ester carboxylesterase
VVEVTEQAGEVAGLRTVWLEGKPTARDAERPAIVYLHGNPVGSWIWRPFLERTGGVAPDLPGFGRSAKSGDFNYSLRGYADYLERFVDQAGFDRFSLVIHDIGAIVGLVFAQRVAERLDCVVVANHAPLLPGYRWHRFARIWRVPALGELFMATTTGFAFKRSLRPSNVGGLPDEFIDRAWADVDGATKRAILRLYRSMPEGAMVREGRHLDRIRCPALVVWSTDDPYVGAEFGPAYANALGGEVELEVYENAGHWLWLDRPEVIDRVAGFVRPNAVTQPA